MSHVYGYIAKAPAAYLEWLKYPVPELKENEIEVRIDCCGLCYSDIHMIDNDWNNSAYPQLPGHEVIGRVVRKGNEVHAIEPGELVGIGWQCGACAQCEFCLQEEEELCPSKVRTSVNRAGGFADFIRVPAAFAYLIPSNLNPKTTAPLLCGGITVYSPLKKYATSAPMKIAIVGIGGLGHLAIQFARALGCEITAISTSPNKREKALQLGAHHFLVWEPHTNPCTNSFDFILSTTHANLDWTPFLRILRPKGRLCFVGIPKHPLQLSTRELISGEKMVCGSSTGGRSLMKEMLQFAVQHEIQADVQLFPMTEINQAIELVKQRKLQNFRAVLCN